MYLSYRSENIEILTEYRYLDNLLPIVYRSIKSKKRFFNNPSLSGARACVYITFIH